MKTINVNYGKFSSDICVQDDLYNAIYEKGKIDGVADVLKTVYKHFEEHNKVVFDKNEILDEIAQIIDEYYVYLKAKEYLKESK